MPFEIDFLPVGSSSKSGDAIAFRYGNLSGPRGEQTVVTIDGGTLDSGAALVNHIQQFYKTDVVDIAILSHPDMDHASGMRCVLEELTVNQVLMHRPWNHSSAVMQLIDDERATHRSLTNRAEKNLVAAKEVEELALEKRAKIIEPFAGTRTTDGVLTVLGPSVNFYQEKLANFRFMPGATTPRIASIFLEIMGAARSEQESWVHELLKNPPETASSAENNSSTIILLQLEDRKILLTGDAGVPALNGALDFADYNQISYAGLDLFQIPHHGSRKNLGTNLMNRLFGRIRQSDLTFWTAVVSAAVDGAPKHPNKKITNALRRRGASVATTATGGLWHSWNAPARSGFGPCTPLPFYTTVDSDDATE